MLHTHMRFDRDTPITWQGVLFFVSLFVGFVAAMLLATTFAPHQRQGNLLVVQAVSSITLVICIVTGIACYRSVKRMPDPVVDTATVEANRRAAQARVVIYGPLILVIGFLMTAANYANTRAGGTFLVPTGLIVVGLAATVASVLRKTQ